MSSEAADGSLERVRRDDGEASRERFSGGLAIRTSSRGRGRGSPGLDENHSYGWSIRGRGDFLHQRSSRAVSWNASYGRPTVAQSVERQGSAPPRDESRLAPANAPRQPKKDRQPALKVHVPAVETPVVAAPAKASVIHAPRQVAAEKDRFYSPDKVKAWHEFVAQELAGKPTRPPTQDHQTLVNADPEVLNAAHGSAPNDLLPSPLDAIPIPKPIEEWQSWSEVTLMLFNLSPKITTWDLWEIFKCRGTVAFIDIFDTRQGRREGTAKIRFRPPPTENFWSSGQINILLPDTNLKVTMKIRLEPKKRIFQIGSPIRDDVWYPELMTMHPMSLTFGVMLGETELMRMRDIFDEYYNIKFELDLRRSRIVVRFEALTMAHIPSAEDATKTLKQYKFHIPFGQLQQINYSELTTGWALLLSLDNPPQFFQKRLDERASHTAEALTWSEPDTWFRLTDIEGDAGAVHDCAMSLRRESPFIDLGSWTTYYLTFNKKRNEADVFDMMKMALSDYNIQTVRMKKLSVTNARPAALWPLIDPPTLEPDRPQTELAEGKAEYALPFAVRYQLEVCISQGVLQLHSIGPDFVEKLSTMAEEEPIRARQCLEYIASQDAHIADPLTIFKDRTVRGYSPNSKIPEYCALVRKATITPTRLYYASPVVETSNRVIRKYAQYHADRFLRVQFTEERPQGKINSCADRTGNDRLFARVYRTLRKGIRIGDRTYEFLAFGNSQFRENGAYFFCPTPDLTCDDIRQWMGNFSKIRVVAKYAARLGLCFSTTRAITNSAVRIVKTRDVERNGYCFTDGVGMISEVLASKICNELKLPASNLAPSAFQFRMGGTKGILTTWPKVRALEVHIRPSQVKFPASSSGLEIIRCSRYSPATLNRQTITILSALGVPDVVFNEMMASQLVDYQAAMHDPIIAEDCLSRYVDENHMTITMASLVSNGFMDVNEPFIMSLMHLWRAWSIKLLKEKARIVVEHGAFLLGVTDETGTLRGHERGANGPGLPKRPEQLPEIFVQIPDKKKKGCYVVIQGICLVGRNPSLFPGDIRVVLAVNKPALHHLRDVIVFSQQGERDIPSMCSGGDLDGDDFFCIWDRALTPVEWNAEPMSYAAPKPMELDRPVEMTDVMRFFVMYMKNDALPTIARSHLALSDYLDQGIKHRNCIELAQLHSKAVDYVKTGEPAVMPQRLRPRVWPHFMQKSYLSHDNVYKSRKILGQLYDRVDSVKFVPQFDLPFDQRILQTPLDNGSFMSKAKHLKVVYDTAVRQIMNQLGIQTEFEIWSTFVLQSSRKVGSDYKMQEEMGTTADALKDRFRKLCIKAAKADGVHDLERMKPFVVAMYKVTAEEMRVALAECEATKFVDDKEVPLRLKEPNHMPLISFPWLFDGILGDIAYMAATGFPKGKSLLPIDPVEKAYSGNLVENLRHLVKSEDEADIYPQSVELPGPDPVGGLKEDIYAPESPQIPGRDSHDRRELDLLSYFQDNQVEDFYWNVEPKRGASDAEDAEDAEEGFLISLDDAAGTEPALSGGSEAVAWPSYPSVNAGLSYMEDLTELNVDLTNFVSEVAKTEVATNLFDDVGGKGSLVETGEKVSRQREISNPVSEAAGSRKIADVLIKHEGTESLGEASETAEAAQDTIEAMEDVIPEEAESFLAALEKLVG